MEGLLYRGVEVTVFDDQEIPALRRAIDQAKWSGLNLRYAALEIILGWPAF